MDQDGTYINPFKLDDDEVLSQDGDNSSLEPPLNNNSTSPIKPLTPIKVNSKPSLSERTLTKHKHKIYNRMSLSEHLGITKITFKSPSSIIEMKKLARSHSYPRIKSGMQKPSAQQPSIYENEEAKVAARPGGYLRLPSIIEVRCLMNLEFIDYLDLIVSYLFLFVGNKECV